MVEKEFVLKNLGMNRDLSVSKAGESSAYENRNIRIVARDHNTLLTVTNERGTKELNLNGIIEGELVGWNVLNNHIILFTHKGHVDNSLALLALTNDDSALEVEVLAMWNSTNTGILLRTIVRNAGDADYAFTESPALILKVYDEMHPEVVFGTIYPGVTAVAAHNVWYQDTVLSVVKGNAEYVIDLTNGDGSVSFVIGQPVGDFDEEAWDDIPQQDVGPDVPPDPETDPLNIDIEASWNTDDTSIDYRITVENVGVNPVTLHDVYVRVIVTNSALADPENGTDVASFLLDNIIVPAQSVEEVSGTYNILRDSKKTYWLHPEIQEHEVLYYEVSVSHEGGGGGGGGEEEVTTKSVWLTPTTINFDLKTPSPVSIYLHELKTDDTDTVVDGNWSIQGGNAVAIEKGTDSVCVTPVATGSCRIIGSYNGFFATCAVTVKDTREDSGGGTNPHGDADEPDMPEDPNASKEPASSGKHDFIYRIDYIDGEFKMIRGKYGPDKIDGVDYEFGKPLYNGNLGFSTEHPIESVVYYETDDVQKIYWVDGKHVLRFMNFTESIQGIDNAVSGWKDTSFDSNRYANFNVTVRINKDNSGNVRHNGVAQYLLTYFNKYGQETGFVWVSDLVYLSPIEHGGSADDTNSNCVYLTIRNLDCRFSHFRIYSIFRSSYNGEVTSYLVSDMRTTDKIVTVVDDGAHLAVQDATRLLYLGSLPVVAGTLAHKDQTLFLGDLSSIGKCNYDMLDSIIRQNMFDDGNGGVASFVENTTWKSHCVQFVYTDDQASGTHGNADTRDIPYVQNVGNYSYQNQLIYSSSRILTFKGGEKYRFALKFTYHDGTSTEAFWIGDLENTLYPVIDKNQVVIKRVIAKCILPEALLNFIQDPENGFATVQLLVAEATYADRSVKAQGIINPTMFNVWERYNGRTYSIPSWISRPRGSRFTNRHFDVVAKSTSTTGEIQCNYWESQGTMVPYFQYKNYTTSPTYVEELEGAPEYTDIMFVFGIEYQANFWGAQSFIVHVDIILGRTTVSSSSDSGARQAMLNHTFGSSAFKDMVYKASIADDHSANGYFHLEPRDGEEGYRYEIFVRHADISGGSYFALSGASVKAVDSVWNKFVDTLVNTYSVPEALLPAKNTFSSWCVNVASGNLPGNLRYASKFTGTAVYTDPMILLNYPSIGGAWPSSASAADRWESLSNVSVVSANPSSPAYYKKHLMFVDENVVTLDSPELQYEAVSFDNADYGLRLVGVSKMSSVISDYTVDATRSSVPGASLDVESFSGTLESRNGNIDGIITWPLWKEYGLQLNAVSQLNDVRLSDRTPDDYDATGRIIHYWLYMWHHSGLLTGYTKPVDDKDNTNYSVLNRKVFANLRYSYNTIYFKNAVDMGVESLRCVSELSHSYHTIRIGNANSYEDRYYNGDVSLGLTVPGTLRYPLLLSDGVPDNNIVSLSVSADDAYFASSAPVMLEYRTNSHAVLSFETSDTVDGYVQTILPRFRGEGTLQLPPTDTSRKITGALIPWTDFLSGKSSYPYKNYGISQQELVFSANNPLADTLDVENDQYLFIGEIYKDYGEGAADTRYGGISLSAVKNNRFIAAGPQYNISSLTGNIIFGNQGDTYFQRWDCLRTKPYSSDSANNVIDITSVMLETHINLDGRTDLQRGITELASINTAQFGMLNNVYSQMNNFSVSHDIDDEFNTDSYRSAVTWTLQKNDMTDTDEWTHVTLASTMKLDADKGICRAIRRFQNTLVAFQDRAISEILFNSRTQLTTHDGVPVEIGNSGKVDGKRYITNKYGCLNKWSIVEGKAALYFVDNINKAFCSFNGNVDNLSSKLGFSVWFKNGNSTEPWRPDRFNNVVSFYDRLHSDVYLVRANADNPELPALVYNEVLGRFTSFFNYSDVPMMANVEDCFVSFRNNNLWMQNGGAYGNFFGTQYPFSVQYRITPNPFGDKIWTNVEYRADFYRVLEDGEDKYPVESDFTDDVGIYQPDETFDHMRFWNEYQTTPTNEDYLPKIEKKFRVWRVIIPRAVKTTKNKFGLDRIRNPWLNLLFSKKAASAGEKQDLMQLHDITVKYFE